MWWWIATVVTWLVSFGGIVYVMADVFRRRLSFGKALPGYLFHGVTAVLALWFLKKALGAGGKAMTVFLRVAGFVLLLSGVTGAIWIVGGVLSHVPLLAMPVPIAIHFVLMVGGVDCLNAAAKRRKAAEKTASV